MKKLKILLIALILVLGGMFFSNTFAANIERNLGAQMERPFTSKKYQYGVDGQTPGSMLYYTAVKIFDEADVQGTTKLYSTPFYCLRGGVGFGVSTTNPSQDVSQSAVKYIQSEKSEMHENANDVIAKYKELYNVELNRTETINGTENVNIYNAILWILDESYLPKDIEKEVNGKSQIVYDASEYKKELLDKAGVPTVQQGDITDDDLEVIQQLAVWYFANYDEQTAGTNPTVSQSIMFPAQLRLTMDGTNNIGEKAKNLDRIYQYLIYGAIDNAETYPTTGERTKTIENNEFDDTSILTIQSINISVPGMEIGPNSYYKIGPVKIKSDVNSRTGEKTVDATSIVLYDNNGSPIDKYYIASDGVTKSKVYEFIDGDGKTVKQLKKGMEYYIKFIKVFEKGSTILPFITADEQYDVSKVTLKITSSYSLSTATFLYAANNASNNQAVVELEKENLVSGDEITTRYYDLVLRKFITSINGQTLAGTNSRVPNIDISKLNTIDSRNQKITTARYEHPKNALSVETGDKVVYTLRIYNEGEIDGKATEITDYLPEGLELVPVSESRINTQYKWTNPSGDGKTIVTDYLKDTTIKAYDSTKTAEEAGWQKASTGNGGLYYADVQVECKVVALVSQTDKTLKNVAEITEDDNGNDRDSDLNSVYAEDNEHTPGTEDNGYFPGEQDDDDYENLLLKTKEFDLSLRKFITKVQRGQNELDISSRVPQIEIAQLKNGQADTAEYVHPKNTVSLKRGDIITYTIRVYNEGQLDGYTTEVKDYLPEGLELVEGQNNIWTVYGNTLTTDALKNQLLLGYDKDTTSVADGVNWQKASDDETGLYYYDLEVVCRIKDNVTDGAILKNVAEITNDRSEPVDIGDRDSEPGSVYDEDNEHTPGTEVNGYTPGEEDDDDFEKVKVEPNEVFDLSLRKYITKVEGTEVATRNPDINKDNLGNGAATAEYKHRKDPVEVKTGNKVTYKITIYNEGEMSGRATKVVDQLPAGLKFIRVISGNYEVESYDEGTNKLTLKETTNNSNLEAYNKETKELKSATVEIECEVTELIGRTDKVLTNIAWISEEYNAETNTTITNQEKEDRDSEPIAAPNKTAEELRTENIGYTGKDNHEASELSGNTYFEGQQDDDDFEKLVIKGRNFDLALRKYITKVEGTEVATRNPDINKDNLGNGAATAEYKHRKDPVEVKTGSKVTYKITIYNEGELSGRATKVVDQLPAGLKFIRVISGNYEVESYDEGTNKLTLKETTDNGNLDSYNKETKELKSTTIEIECEVIEKVGSSDKVLTNIAWISEEYNAETNTTITNQEKEDRDSEPIAAPNKTAEELRTENIGYTGKDSHEASTLSGNTYFEGQQDDDDFEKIIIKGKPFDLSLRKFITSIKRNGTEVLDTDRTPSIDTTTLIEGTFNRNGELEHTATYNHSKEPLVVKQGDIITYTLRIYNEGERAGYATEITDYIPEGLALIKDYKTNFDNEWLLPQDVNTSNIINLIGEDGFYKTEEEIKNLKLEDFENTTTLNEVQLIKGKVNITSNLLDDELLKPFDKTLTEETAGEGWQKAETGEGGLYYKDIEVSCLVIAENTYKDTITNIAEISDDKDEFGNDVIDDDSEPKNKQEPYTTSQEDDDDYEPVILRYFDLALRKFITGVETNGKLVDVSSRIPNLSIDEKTGNIKYTHPKEEEPVSVANNDVVIYTLRVYNEGTLAGYAEQITDDIPEGLIYLPQHDVNKQYEWKMYDKDGKVTDELEEAETIKTEYLSEEKQTDTRKNLINPFDSSKELGAKNPEYKDVKVAFRVIEPNTSNRIIENCAQISKDSDDDDDSIPDKWNEGEDDQDKEYIYVKYFDLSLLKWVTQTIVTVDGKTTTTETGFKPNTGLTETTGIRENEENEPVAKVEIDKNKLNKTTVKFVYKIRVTNEGEMAGYATEITDFIPEGLEFKEEDNKKYGWVKEGEDKVTTRALETVLLEPGENAEVEIVFTWKNDKNNLDVKRNVAEITEDYNENNSPDIDSTPENKEDPYEKEQEDDDDFALVVLSIKTGKGASYTLLITAVIAMLAGGIYLIKKYVLTY